MPAEYWESVLCDPFADASPMRVGRPQPDAAAVGDFTAFASGVLRPLRPDRRDPEGRCYIRLYGRTAVWKEVEQRLLNRHMPAANRRVTKRMGAGASFE